MRRPVPKLTYILIVAVVLITTACTQRDSGSAREASPTTEAEMRTALDVGAGIDREAPFAMRPFDPMVDGKWVGHAVSYGPYRAGQAPGGVGPSDAELLEDLTIIAKHWNLIRVYGADDDTERILEAIDANDLPIKVMLGIWLEPEADNPQRRDANITQVLRGIGLANEYRDIVNAINVGNETQVYWSGHRMQPQNLIRYVRAVRGAVSVPVTTADDYNFWNKPESKEVAEEVDFIVLHMHPVWNGQTLESAVGWLNSTYEEVQSLHPTRKVVVGETGWATQYDASKTGPGQQGTLVKGEVSVGAQAEYLIQLHQWTENQHVTTFLFEAFDEPWKGGESAAHNDIEKHWGIFYEDRSPKESLVRYLEHNAGTAN